MLLSRGSRHLGHSQRELFLVVNVVLELSTLALGGEVEAGGVGGLFKDVFEGCGGWLVAKVAKAAAA